MRFAPFLVTFILLLAACDDEPVVFGPGDIRVTTNTTGVDPDPDGYTVRLDDIRVQPIDANGTLVFEDVDEGQHAIVLSGVAANCSVSSDNPRLVLVASGRTIDVVFEVECILAGSLRISVSTAGDSIDADGYQVEIEGAGSEAVTPDGTVTIEGLPPGDRSVELFDVAPNCSVTDPNPRTVTVLARDTVASLFEVTCLPALLDRIVFTSERDGDPEIFVMTDRGTELLKLTENTAADEAPSVSPDGTRIAFASRRDGDWEIYVMGHDGSGPLNLTNDPTASDRDPAWSPDGTKVAFTSDRDGNLEIYVMNADGSNVTRLTNDPGIDEEPAWSPDGSRIAFTSERDGNRDIYVMEADGSSATNLTSNAATDEHPAYAPDGSRIAFSTDRDGDFEIYAVMAVDGSDPVNLTNNLAADRAPAWSPDGSRIAISTDRDGDPEIYLIEVMRAGISKLTDDGAVDTHAAWSPRRR